MPILITEWHLVEYYRAGRITYRELEYYIKSFGLTEVQEHIILNLAKSVEYTRPNHSACAIRWLGDFDRKRDRITIH